MTRVLEVVCREVTSSGEVLECRRQVYYPDWEQLSRDTQGRLLGLAMTDSIKAVDRELKRRWSRET